MKYIFKSKLSDRFQLLLLLSFMLLFIIVIIIVQFLAGIGLLLLFCLLVAINLKVVYITAEYVLVRYPFFVQRNKEVSFASIAYIEIVSTPFNTPNVSIVTTTKPRRINFEYGTTKNYSVLFKWAKSNGITVIDKTS